MPLDEQRRPGSVKAHGKATAARRSGRMWLRKERSVSASSFSTLPRGRASGRDDGLLGNARGFDPIPDAHNTGIVPRCEDPLKQTSLVFRHGSAFIL